MSISFASRRASVNQWVKQGRQYACWTKHTFQVRIRIKETDRRKWVAPTALGERKECLLEPGACGRHSAKAGEQSWELELRNAQGFQAWLMTCYWFHWTWQLEGEAVGSQPGRLWGCSTMFCRCFSNLHIWRITGFANNIHSQVSFLN